MTKDEKLAALKTCMAQSTRDDGTEYTHFTDTAPEELKSLYLAHYEVRTLDYEIFADACDIVADVYTEKKDRSENDIDNILGEQVNESASIWNADRLGYLNIWNEEEIKDLMSQGYDSISEACAAWYCREVSTATHLLKDWANEPAV